MYSEKEDGLKFSAWYHVDDIKRVIWKKYNQLNHAFTKDSMQPFVFFDGLDQFTLEDMLSPLITKLKESTKKYFPFIFKPELASVHYVAGFLRKNDDNTVSIILFNPTGTTLRVDYGNYDYQFRLRDDDNEEGDFLVEKNVLYFKILNNVLQYTVINPAGSESTAFFSD